MYWGRSRVINKIFTDPVEKLNTLGITPVQIS